MLQEGQDQLQLTTGKLMKVVKGTRKHAGKGPDAVDRQVTELLPEQGWQALNRVLQCVLALGILSVHMLPQQDRSDT